MWESSKSSQIGINIETQWNHIYFLNHSHPVNPKNVTMMLALRPLATFCTSSRVKTWKTETGAKQVMTIPKSSGWYKRMTESCLFLVRNHELTDNWDQVHFDFSPICRYALVYRNRSSLASAFAQQLVVTPQSHWRFASIRLCPTVCCISWCVNVWTRCHVSS